jgi:hypothetical protein
MEALLAAYSSSDSESGGAVDGHAGDAPPADVQPLLAIPQQCAHQHLTPLREDVVTYGSNGKAISVKLSPGNAAKRTKLTQYRCASGSTGAPLAVQVRLWQ